MSVDPTTSATTDTARPPKPGPEQSREALLHELQVHQVELELQNHELRDAQNALESSRNRYAELYDFAPFPYFTFDERGRVQDVNLAGAALLGRERRALLGLPFLSLVQMSDPTQFWSHLRRCASVRARVVTELGFACPGAGFTTVQATSEPIIDGTGFLQGVRTAFADVTEQRQAEVDRKATFATAELLRTQLERIDRAMLVVTRALTEITGSSGLGPFFQVIVDQARVVVNADYAIFGGGDVRPGEPFTSYTASGIPEGQVGLMGAGPRATGVMGAVLRERRALRLDDLTQHPEFRGFPHHHPRMKSFLGVPVRYGEKVLGTLYLTNKRGEAAFSEQDQRSAELLAERVGVAIELARLRDASAAAVQSRDTLLAIVSHDLRNLLSVVSLKSSLLLRGRREQERRREGVHALSIRDSVQRMARLIEDLLQASTIEAGEFSIETHPEDPASVIASCFEQLEPLAAAESLRLERTIPPGLPRLLCDRDRLLQVFSNLIGNAIKFSPPGGVVRVEVARDDGTLRFSVSDTGSGIAPEDLPRLFDRYWRGRSTGKRGTGLGLYISRAVVVAHGGRIWVESTPGAGTTFFFTLPAHQVALPDSDRSAAPVDTSPLKGRRVLIVDDEVAAASALATLLGDEGVSATTANSGAEALRVLGGASPDAVVLDIEMPGMSGLALLQQARQRVPDLPAVIMSGYGPDHPGLRDALATRNVAYLAKPIDLDKLLAALAHVVPATAQPLRPAPPPASG